MDQFQLGDLVFLKDVSGPEMIVAKIEDQQCECWWFNKNYDFRRESFPTAMLEKHKPSSTGFVGISAELRKEKF